MLTPQITVPVAPNPIVESTVITEDPTDTGFITFVLPVMLNVPSIRSTSLNPTNKPNL